MYQIQMVLPAKKEELDMAGRNKIKTDSILKNFWKNNEHFADLFNAVVFDGRSVLNPNDLTEVDTDLSSTLKFNGHVETVQRVFDVVKKAANGVEFVILGLENQEEVHYAMPLRHMLGDALSYLKEYNEVVAKNRKINQLSSSSEFLSGISKEERLHPIISLCVYYGDEEWDGPLCLTDMLDIPEDWKELVSDYKMNLVQVRKSGLLKFQNEDVDTVFKMIRLIYNKRYEEFNENYEGKLMDTELALVIGSITNSQRIINQALNAEKKGEKMNMCKVWEEIEQNAISKGISQGVSQGKEEMLRDLVRKKLCKRKSVKEIANELEQECSVVQKIIDELEVTEAAE